MAFRFLNDDDYINDPMGNDISDGEISYNSGENDQNFYFCDNSIMSNQNNHNSREDDNSSNPTICEEIESDLYSSWMDMLY